MTEPKKLGKPKPRTGEPKAYTTTLALSGLGAKLETIEEARSKGYHIPLHVKRANILLYGPPKVGKTVAAHAMPRTRTLDFDNGMQSVEWAIREGIIKKDPSEIVYKTILPPPGQRQSTFVIDEAADTIDEWIADEDIPPEEWDRPYPQFWDTLIIDGGTGLTEASTILGLKENNRLGLSKSWDRMLGSKKLAVTPVMIQDYKSAQELFQTFINNCRSIGKNVVLICHEYYEYEGEGENERLISVDPLLIGQLRNKIPKDFDEVWYAHVKGTRQKPEYMFQTTPDSLHRLGSRSGCLDPVEPANFPAIKKKIAKYYNIPEDQIWHAYHGTEGVARAVEEQINAAGGI